MTMTDAEVREQIARADAFREQLRDAISQAAAAVNPHSACATEARAGLARIAATLDAVDDILIANLSNLDAALKRRTGTGGLMSMIELHLFAVGAGPTLDHASAADFLRAFEPLVEMARKRRVN